MVADSARAGAAKRPGGGLTVATPDINHGPRPSSVESQAWLNPNAYRQLGAIFVTMLGVGIAAAVATGGESERWNSRAERYRGADGGFSSG